MKKPKIKKYISVSEELVRKVPNSFNRYLYYKADIDKRILGIIGRRGTGRTTLMLQLAARLDMGKYECLYINMDDPEHGSSGTKELLIDFIDHGGKLLLIDELDKAKDYRQLLESIIRENKELRVIFVSGRSVELPAREREMGVYELYGLSFREYLQFNYDLHFPVIAMDELLEFNRLPGREVLNKIRPLKYFDEYLERGYYPFSGSGISVHRELLRQLVKGTVVEDIRQAYNTDNETVDKINKLLVYIAGKGPFRPNIEGMAEIVGTTRDSLLKFLRYLNGAGLIHSLYGSEEKKKKWGKPDRLYIANQDLLSYLGSGDAGFRVKREVFILSQLSAIFDIKYKRPGSFLLEGEFVFECGGEEEKSPQKDSNRYYITSAAEDRRGNRIPAWMLGFLY